MKTLFLVVRGLWVVALVLYVLSTLGIDAVGNLLQRLPAPVLVAVIVVGVIVEVGVNLGLFPLKPPPH